MDDGGKTQNQTLLYQLGVFWPETGLESPNSLVSFFCIDNALDF
jgi:hypothetical protein